MLIKSVTIQGFKTFALRTDFVFDPGVTAIVGPNGSGKSNVVDAIRWCLGEQSFSLLRSKKTGDVIFAGSDRRSRLGMAEVRLTLDNSAGELPIDFAEIEIARRAYRDGVNEYLLNGKRVRLSDITNLLAQTGLGRRTYALIGQGLIDRVLSLAPEELRSLFEEAAGITGYQSKRVATLRQLDAAQSNLLRVQDVLAELSPRLGTLKRQANRAREREAIAQELQGLLRDWYGYHWHQNQLALAQHRIESGRQKNAVGSLQNRLGSLDTEIAKIRAQQTQLRSDLAGLHRESSELHRHAEQFGKRLAVAQERLRQLRERREEYMQELAPLQQRKEALHGRIQELKTGIDEAGEKLTKLLRSAETVQHSLEEFRKKHALRAQEIAEARDSVSNFRSQMSAALARIDQQTDRISELQEEIATHIGQVEEATAQEAALSSGLEAVQAEHKATAQFVELEENALTRLEQHAESLQVELATAEQQLQEIERKHEQFLTRQELLQRLRDDGAGYASGVRAVLQAIKSTQSSTAPPRIQLEGVHGTVASLVRVPEHLEKAMEVAIGAAYQNIVTTTWEDARNAIAYLDKTGRGRATFLPLDRIYIPDVIKAPSQEGVVGNAALLIDCDSKVKPVIRHLLNRTWIVNDLNAARIVLDQINKGPRPTVVTLSGEIVRPGGAVTGGSDHSRRDDSVLARERELRQIPTQLQEIQSRLSGLVAKRDDLQNGIRQIRDDAALIQVRLSALRDRLATQEEAVAQRKQLHAQARHSLEWRNSRLHELNEELSTIRSSHEDAERRQQECKVLLDEAETILASLEEANPTDEHDKLRVRLTDERTAVAKAETEVANKRMMLREQESGLANVTEQIQSKREQIAAADEEERRLVETISDIANQEQEISWQIAELQAKISPLENDLQRLEAIQETTEASERRLQEDLRKQESVWNAAQLQFQRSQDAVDQLRTNIENDLGLVFWETSTEDDIQPPLPWDTIVQQLPRVEQLPDATDEAVRDLRARLSKVSNVNPDAPREYEEVAARHSHMSEESHDLECAIADLRKVLRELDVIMEAELQHTFAAVSEQFLHFFDTLFTGGTARLVLAEPDDIANSGIEIIARPPGKRPQTLALLSGGERTLTACALIFAILKVSPTPFCVLDEVDAALDEANIDRFRDVISELCDETQFILITHNRRTLEGTNAIYGITLGNDGASRVISLRLNGDTIVQDGHNSADLSSEAVQTIESVVQM